MATLLADSAEDQRASRADGAIDEPSTGTGVPAPAAGAPDSSSAPAAPPCRACGAPMAAGQEWCLDCGAGAGAGGGVGIPGWRSAAAILGATAVLVLGAAAAGYAALSKNDGNTPVASTVAQTPPVSTAPPTATTPLPSTPGTTSTPVPKLPTTAVTPPKLPSTTTTPTTPTGGTGSETDSGKEDEDEGGDGKTGGSESQPEPILLDTDAASTYNPYAYDESLFGDPALTIDGDKSTAWTAAVQPTVAPALSEGVLISLKSKQKVALLKLTTATPGMTVQVFGANGKTPPDSITAPGWTTLSDRRVTGKHHVELKLRYAKKRTFSMIVLWVSKAPDSSTPADPGAVSVGEIELFPPAS